MDLQHWSIINLERVNWEIYLVNNLYTLVEILPNSSLSFLKKLPNKVIELLSLSLLYSPPFLTSKHAIKVVSHCLDSIASKASLTLRWTGHTPTRMGMIHFGIVVRKQQMFPKDWYVEDLYELQID